MGGKIAFLPILISDRRAGDLMLLQVLIGGLSMGAIYGLVALGTVLIINSVDIVNFCQGETVMIGAFLAATCFLYWHLPTALSILVTLVLMVGFGYLFQLVAYYPLRNKPPITVIVCTIGIGIFLKNTAMIIWGSDPLKVPGIVGDASLSFSRFHFSWQNIIIILVAAAIMVLQKWFFERTAIGMQMHATSQDHMAARLMGIKVNRMIAYTFILGTGIIAAVAGILMGPVYYVYPTMGYQIGLKSFAGIIIGGYGNIQGAFLGGLLIGIFEALGAGYVSSVYTDAYAFILVILVLVFRPQGIFGEKVTEKV